MPDPQNTIQVAAQHGGETYTYELEPDAIAPAKRGADSPGGMTS
jgi:hypothetical protein